MTKDRLVKHLRSDHGQKIEHPSWTTAKVLTEDHDQLHLCLGLSADHVHKS
jgi:hypothetical protein